MGRALECPLCRSTEIGVEEVTFTRDLWSNMPALSVETMLALVCRHCRHVRIIHPMPITAQVVQSERN